MATQAELLEAIQAGKGERVAALLAGEPALALTCDADGRSVILLAVYYGHRRIAEMIAGHAPALTIWEATALGRTARVAELITAGAATANATSPDGFTPAGLAAFFGHPETLRYLLDHGADPNTPAANATRVRPLHSAVAHDDDTVAMVVTDMLLAAGAAVNVRQAGGWTPLHQAAARGHAEMVRRLLDYGADPDAANDDGQTPRDTALASNHPDIAALLVAS